MKKGLLPTLSFGSETVSSEAMPLIMNLVGLEETLTGLVKEPSPGGRAAQAEKIVQTAAQVAAEKSGKNEKLGVAIVDEDGASRLATLDLEKYGRGNLPLAEKHGYSNSPRLTPSDLQNQEKVAYISKLSEGLKGGLSVCLDASSLDLRSTFNMINAASPTLSFFKVHRTSSFCRNCGAKLQLDAGRCKRCKSTATSQYSTAE